MSVNFPYAVVVGYKDGKPIYHKVGSCDSQDTKPTGTAASDIADGSILIESDTGMVTFYNERTDAWVEQFSFQG